MKNSADLGGCYSPRPSASVDNTLPDPQNSSYPTRPHSLIANYTMLSKYGKRACNPGGRFNFYFRLVFYILGAFLIKQLGSLSTRVFETRTATGKKHFARYDRTISQIFILLISDGEKILINVNVVV